MVYILLEIVIIDSTYLNLLRIQQTITLGSGCGIFLLIRRINYSFGRLYISPFLGDRCCIIVVCSRQITALNAIKTLRQLYTIWDIVNLILTFGNLLTSWTHYSSKRIIYMIGLDMTSMMTLSFCLLTGGCGALGTN